MAIFGITQQQAHLKKRAEDLAKQRRNVFIEPVKGIKTAARDANHCCELLNVITATRTGMLKSFIPFTTAFRRRRECAEKLQRLSGLLDLVERRLKHGKAYVPAPQVCGTALKKSYSDSCVQPVIYRSPLAPPPPAQRAADDSVLVRRQLRIG
jgi:hypothetical protein